MIHIPLGLALLARSRGVNWGLATQPEPALNGRRLYWPRGRTLGGSSSINAMIDARGHPDDYRIWAEAAGPEWGWNRVRSLFMDLEANGAHGLPHHGQDGPLAVNDLRHVNPLSHAFVEAGVQAGFAANPDFNGDTQEGVGFDQVTQREGRRFSAARAFLLPAMARPNLTIRTGAQVRRVLFQGRRAVGVDLGDQVLRLRPGGQVILSGGAVNSPHLLMLSGIGPGAELARAGIAVLHDAP